MSNILPEQSPAPSPPDFIHNLVCELDAMHGEGKAHGDIKVDAKSWLDIDAKFDSEKFRNSATCSLSDKDSIASDVNNFMSSARTWVSGLSSSDHATFRADHYSQTKLPLSFLKMLEIKDAENLLVFTMSDFLKALEEVPPESPQLTNTSSHEETITTPEPELKPNVASAPSIAAIPISIALPNGTVGKPYTIEPGKIARAIAAQRKDNPELARIVHLQLPDDCGLTFDAATGTVSGVPTKSLEQQLHLDYISSSSASSISCKVSLFVNPDPASLWKDLRSSPDAPYQKEPLYHKEYSFDHFRVVAASRRGRSHANRGDFRDDDFAVGYAEATGWLVVVVADGAGSAKYSRQGSRIAVNVACDRLVAILSTPEYADISAPKASVSGDATSSSKRKWLPELLYETALHAHYKIKEEVDNPSELLPEPPVIRNFDTTLILMVMKKDKQAYFAATFSIGDGGAGIISGKDNAEALTHSDGGEHAGQTTFVTIASSLINEPENIAKRFNMTTALDFTAALSMTDGITDPKFPSDAAFADPKSWLELWDELKPVVDDSAALLEWMNFFSPGNHDDRTLVVVMPKDLANV